MLRQRVEKLTRTELDDFVFKNSNDEIIQRNQLLDNEFLKVDEVESKMYYIDWSNLKGPMLSYVYPLGRHTKDVEFNAEFKFISILIFVSALSAFFSFEKTIKKSLFIIVIGIVLVQTSYFFHSSYRKQYFQKERELLHQRKSELISDGSNQPYNQEEQRDTLTFTTSVIDDYQHKNRNPIRIANNRMSTYLPQTAEN
ncbi:MAG: hypothetical protein CMB64_04955 [Euryarchaeota archaeon]|nr:hypothetical protein [Euryarchaeota archaeon]|tara:strand:+ start:1082 stop:1675 length:594 start_codon:yes stop_codon:yes gene_type:complete